MRWKAIGGAQVSDLQRSDDDKMAVWNYLCPFRHCLNPTHCAVFPSDRRNDRKQRLQLHPSRLARPSDNSSPCWCHLFDRSSQRDRHLAILVQGREEDSSENRDSILDHLHFASYFHRVVDGKSYSGARNWRVLGCIAGSLLIACL